jgi:hypothetical protein
MKSMLFFTLSYKHFVCSCLPKTISVAYVKTIEDYEEIRIGLYLYLEINALKGVSSLLKRPIKM